MTNQVTVKGLDNPMPHFVLVPLMAQGHMIPMVDMARLLADRGARISFITTRVNAARIRNVIDRVESDGLPIRFVELPFPCNELGLPDGCENVDLVPSRELYKPFFEAFSSFKGPLELYLRDQNLGSTCIVTDSCQWWTMEVAEEFNIPRFIFHGPSCFFLLSALTIREHKIYERVTDEFEPFVVPDLPQKIEVTRAQAPGWFDSPGWEKIRENVMESETRADGVVVNSFHELEPEYFERYKKAIGKKVWPIGPVSLYNKDVANKASRGNKASIDEHLVLSWLDSMEPGSVIFANFGSLARSRPEQIIEIGCGLEASNRPFIWVMKEAEKCPEVDEWMSNGFEERTGERSLIITGWAPQVVILSHPAVGGFMTHCGWNSTLEAISAGVPMITWPHFADQFLNEKLVVEVLRTGVAVGVTMPSFPGTENEVLVKRDEVEKAVVSLMDGGKEAEERRERARVFGMKARKAMEVGGSSYENLTRLIQYVSGYAKTEGEGKEF